jgi:O-antigen/teichoic acid export membrane protein
MVGTAFGSGPARGVVLAAHARFSDPLLRNGYALVANTLVSAALGVSYWIVASRLFDPVEVGRASAAIAVMSLLASIAGMNLTAVLSYLLPRAGPAARSYVLRSYGASLVFAVVLALPILVLAILDRDVPGVPELTRWDLALLTLGVPVWVIFMLQDGVLIGARRSSWVLVENTVFGAAKLALLPLAAMTGLSAGIFVSWLAPVLIAVVWVNLAIVLRILPRLAVEEHRVSIDAAGVRRFVGVNYVGSVLNQAYFNLLPVLVLVVVGGEANGLFYVAWMLASSLDLLSHGMGASLTVEGAATPERLHALTVQVVRQVALLVVPLAAIMFVGAPLVLSLYGPDYAEASSGVLRLLALGALPRALVVVAQAAARASGDARATLRTEALTCLLVLGLSVALLPTIGPLAVGVGWAVGNTAVMLLLLRPFLRILRSSAP